MKKYPIGFNTKFNEETDIVTHQVVSEEPRKSVVQVYFPSKNINLAYYNDLFNLKVGDFVYVDGKFEGQRGQVIGVNYSFKIKLSDYQKVIAVIDANVKGDFYFAGSHLVSFDKNALPYEKVRTWFKAPECDEEYAISTDSTKKFKLADLTKMDVSGEIAERGHDYYVKNKVVYISLDNNHGYAIVEGSEAYEVEFDYFGGEISNLTCTCFCSYTCKHDFATMLQLNETLEFITDNYNDKYNDYFVAISKNYLMDIVMNKKDCGKLSLEV